ncbi:HAD-IIB family hydrolase [Clostridium sp. D33t1_170424_F3]|uniref:HAD-IIB family hydrolase n=1 Tax=Clostridium sp. D33t1_170424_F3 TaxID=2787099 RepID=UPI0018AAB649|nr:HAD-IIB family hydrolase [Clostridium sp. D33t1_170424_F3]
MGVKDRRAADWERRMMKQMTKPYQGAVFFDADGTLIDGPAGVFSPTPKTCAAIARLQEQNILTVLATGRSECYILPDLRRFGCYITANGAHAECGGAVIHDRAIASNALRDLTAYLDGAKLNYVLETPALCYCKDLNERCFHGMMQKYGFPKENFLPLSSLDGLKINKLMVMYDAMDKRDRFLRDFGDRYDITDQPGNQACDVGQKGVSKGSGVEQVLAYFHIPRESACAFGDADNDYDMLAAVGTGVAMGRHTKRLEEVAAFVTGTVQEDGIDTALRKLCLI